MIFYVYNFNLHYKPFAKGKVMSLTLFLLDMFRVESKHANHLNVVLTF